MKVYVDELPSCCEDCVCHNGVSGRCKLLHRTTFDIPPRDCPLKPLSDHTKQVRKETIDDLAVSLMIHISKDAEFTVEEICNWLQKVKDQISTTEKI